MASFKRDHVVQHLVRHGLHVEEAGPYRGAKMAGEPTVRVTTQDGRLIHGAFAVPSQVTEASLRALLQRARSMGVEITSMARDGRTRLLAEPVSEADMGPATPKIACGAKEETGPHQAQCCSLEERENCMNNEIQTSAGLVASAELRRGRVVHPMIAIEGGTVGSAHPGGMTFMSLDAASELGTALLAMVESLKGGAA